MKHQQAIRPNPEKRGTQPLMEGGRPLHRAVLVARRECPQRELVVHQDGCAPRRRRAEPVRRRLVQSCGQGGRARSIGRPPPGTEQEGAPLLATGLALHRGRKRSPRYPEQHQRGAGRGTRRIAARAREQGHRQTPHRRHGSASPGGRPRRGTPPRVSTTGRRPNPARATSRPPTPGQPRRSRSRWTKASTIPARAWPSGTNARSGPRTQPRRPRPRGTRPRAQPPPWFDAVMAARRRRLPQRPRCSTPAAKTP